LINIKTTYLPIKKLKKIELKKIELIKKKGKKAIKIKQAIQR